jgi:hypothetical protein
LSYATVREETCRGLTIHKDGEGKGTNAGMDEPVEVILKPKSPKSNNNEIPLDG